MNFRTVSRGCVACAREDDSRRYKDNPEKRNKWKMDNPERVKIHQNKADAKRYKNNPEYILNKNKRWSLNNPEKRAQISRKSKGIPEPTRPMPESCERCGNSEYDSYGNKKALCVDHCHETGKFRGWLCVKCNSGIGLLGDTLKDLLECADYLKRFEEQEDV
jgi:hypothetical protein